MTITSPEVTPALTPAEEQSFNNYSVLHGLTVAIAELDTARRDELLARLGQLSLPAFSAPDGYSIVVEPFSPRSREVPLSLECKTDWSQEWRRLSPTSQFYDRIVSRDKIFDEFFVGQTIEQDGDGQMYVYPHSDRDNFRAHVDHKSTFKLVRRHGR